MTVPAWSAQGLSTFNVHITSPTTAATGGTCPGTGTVNNTGSVTTTNDGSGQASASTCVGALRHIQIVKTPDAAQVDAGDPIGFTLTVSNNGAGDAHGVTLMDTLPTNAGLNWSIAGQGSAGWNNTCAIAGGHADLRPGHGARGDDPGCEHVHGSHPRPRPRRRPAAFLPRGTGYGQATRAT